METFLTVKPEYDYTAPSLVTTYSSTTTSDKVKIQLYCTYLDLFFMLFRSISHTGKPHGVRSYSA